MSNMSVRLHKEDPVIDSSLTPFYWKILSQGYLKRKILTILYEEGSAGYYIFTPENKGEFVRIRKVTDDTEKTIREVIYHIKREYQVVMGMYLEEDGIKSNTARISTNKQEQSGTKEDLEKLLREMDQLINF